MVGGGYDALRVSRIGGRERRALIANSQRKLLLYLTQRAQQLVAHRRSAQLQDRLVGEWLHGAASSSSSGVPRDCSCRNDSLEVFSSNRRTRYAMPATSSPTGQ